MSERQLTDREQSLLERLEEAVEILDRKELPYAFLGGLASAVHGSPDLPTDVDVFVREEHADEFLEAFEQEGYETSKENTRWLYKAKKDGPTVDLIFRSMGGVQLDDEVLSHLKTGEFKGVQLRVISPEDLIVAFALAHQAPTAEYWFNAIDLIQRCEIDWDYLIKRARLGAKRLLSLVIYADSTGITVPADALQGLLDAAYPGTGGLDRKGAT